MNAFDDTFQLHVSADLAEILPAYLEHRAPELATLRAALAGGDLEQARLLGHKLKGSGGAFGLDEVSRLGAALELAAKGDDLASARVIASTLDDYFRGLEVIYDAS